MGKTSNNKIRGAVVSVSAGGNDDLSKNDQPCIDVDFGGIAGDHHRGASREAYSGEREPEGTRLRNDRQWSAVSEEELDDISRALDLSEPLTAATLGANLCIRGVPDFSLLPRGTRLKFSSGAALMIEEYNPPCMDMGEQLASKFRRADDAVLSPRDWLKPASGRRGVVGMVDVPGRITVGDEVEISIFSEPPIRRWSMDELLQGP